MPILVVNARNQRVSIPAAPLAVSITGSGAAALDLRGAAAQQVVHGTAQQAVLPQLTGPIAVAVRPVGAPRFAAGTVVHLTIAHDNPAAADPFQVLFDPVDVSGEAEVVFAELTPRGRHIDVGVSAVADTTLSPLAAAARTSARRLIGRSGPQVRGGLVVAVNASASMRPWFDNGSAAAATDVVVGVADALGIGQVSAVLVGADLTPVRPADTERPGGPAAGLAEALRAAAPAWSAGARWSRLRPDVRTVACSDYPTSAVPQRFPLLVLSDDRRAPGTRLPAPRPGQDAADELLAHPQVLDTITDGLVRAMT
jgi:hypothetical protein